MKKLRLWVFGAACFLVSALASAQTVYYSSSTSHSGDIATAAAALAASLGGSAVDFDGDNAAEWATATANADVIFQGQSGQVASLSPAERSDIADFVSDGGALLLLRSTENVDLMNEILGIAMTTSGSVSGSGLPDIPRTADGDASNFSTAPSVLPTLNDKLPIDTASIPGSVLNAYELSGATHIASATFGAGTVTYLSWDWCCGDTPEQRADWDSALLAAAGFTPRPAVPVPVANPVVLGMLSLMLALFGVRYLRRRTTA